MVAAGRPPDLRKKAGLDSGLFHARGMKDKPHLILRFSSTIFMAVELVMSEMIIPMTKIPTGTKSSMGIIAVLS